MMRLWFGHDSGYDSETDFFFEFRKLCSLSPFFPPRLPARRPWTGPEYEGYEDLNSHL